MKKKIMLLLFILFVASANVIVHAEEQDTQEVITNAFNDKWEELEEQERIAYEMLLQQEIAKDLGIDVPETVFYEDNDGYLGYYNFNSNTVHINNHYKDEPHKIFRAICHEMRHAWQDAEIDKGTEQGQQYLNNLKNYIAPSEETIESYMTKNIIEVDAFAYQKMQVQKYLSK